MLELINFDMGSNRPYTYGMTQSFTVVLLFFDITKPTYIAAL